MNSNLLLSCQEQLIPGGSLEEKFDLATAWGFDSLELRGKGDGQFKLRLPEIKRAISAGVIIKSSCVEMSHFVGDFDADKRKDAINQMTQQLEVMSEIGARLAITPASYGMFSKRLPPFTPPRSDEEDRKVLMEGFGELANRAKELGVLIALEPLNRYEDHMINTLDQAASLIRELDIDSIGIAADTYHMNIEEAEVSEALVRNRDLIAHVQVSDSNRLEPGAGHFNWAQLIQTLGTIGFTHALAYECRLSDEAQFCLPKSTNFLRSFSA